MIEKLEMVAFHGFKSKALDEITSMKMVENPNWTIESLKCQWKDICGQEGDKQRKRAAA